MPDLYGPDPEPPEGDYEGMDTPEQSGVVPPEADEDEPAHCPDCGQPHDEWDSRCDKCGCPLTTAGYLSYLAALEFYVQDHATEGQLWHIRQN